jgi:signal transduction histidine kinase
MKTDFLNAISHELRTPLAPILGYTEILLSGGMGGLPTGAVRGVQAIADSGKRLLNLIESLLAFIRLDQGEMALKRTSVNVSLLLLGIVEAFRARAAERRLALDVSAPAELPPLQADPQELTAAINHLMDNAIKFTPAGGEISVSARQATGADGHPGVEVTVRDTGIGIPADQHEKIFDRFYQVDSSLTRQYGGVGIGLAVVKQCIEAHGSRVTVESEPGKGSTFRFMLPLAAELDGARG